MSVNLRDTEEMKTDNGTEEHQNTVDISDVGLRLAKIHDETEQIIFRSIEAIERSRKQLSKRHSYLDEA